MWKTVKRILIELGWVMLCMCAMGIWVCLKILARLLYLLDKFGERK